MTVKKTFDFLHDCLCNCSNHSVRPSTKTKTNNRTHYKKDRARHFLTLDLDAEKAQSGVIFHENY
jgi:hypothetical protein